MIRSRTGPAVIVVLGVAASCYHAPSPPRVVEGRVVAPTPAAEAPTAAGPANLTEGEDVTAEVRRWNSAEFGAPPTEFRSGNVKARALGPGAVSKLGTGFSIAFPSHAPITTPAVYRGKVVVSGGFHSREMYAFVAQTGKPAWALDLDDDGPSSPACEDNTCVFNTESCTVFSVDVETGNMLWSHWLGDPLTSAPAIANGMVFTAYPARGEGYPQGLNGPPAQAANTPRDAHRAPGPPGASHALAAFDLRSGKLLWTRWIDSDVMSAPVAAADALFATSFGGTVYKFDQKTGDIVAARKARATSAPTIVGSDVFYTKRIDSPPPAAAAPGAPASAAAQPPPIAQASEAIARSSAVAATKNYVVMSKRAAYIDPKVQHSSAQATTGLSLDAANGFGGGAPASANASMSFLNVGQASVSTIQAFQGSRVARIRNLNVNVMGDEVVCTLAEDGKERWRYKLAGDLEGAGGSLGTAPVAAAGSIFVGTLAGEVLRFNADTGKLEKRYGVGSPIRAQLVLADGWLYVPTEDGKLVAVDTGDRNVSGWPMWGHDAARSGVAR